MWLIPRERASGAAGISRVAAGVVASVAAVAASLTAQATPVFTSTSPLDLAVPQASTFCTHHLPAGVSLAF